MALPVFIIFFWNQVPKGDCPSLNILIGKLNGSNLIKIVIDW
jgi:hypothetical protein